MQSVKEIILSKDPLSNFTGSETTRDLVYQQIKDRYGVELASQYDPYRNVLSYPKWISRGFRPKRSEEALTSITFIPKKNVAGEVVGKIKRTVYLFAWFQVEPIDAAEVVVPLEDKEKSEIFSTETHKTAKDRMTDRQRKLLSELIRKRIPRREQNMWYQEMEDFSKFEASEALSSMLLSVGR